MGILAALADGPRDRDGLREATGASGPTIGRVLVGPGAPLLDDAGTALDRALTSSCRGLPAYLLQDLAFVLRAGYVAVRD